MLESLPSTSPGSGRWFDAGGGDATDRRLIIHDGSGELPAMGAGRSTPAIDKVYADLHAQHECMLICMHSTSVRIDASTHDELKRLATEMDTTVGNTVAIAVRALRQTRVGSELMTPLRDDEAQWLDAELG